MAEQIGWRGFVDKLKVEAPQWAHILPQLPRLVQQALTAQVQAQSPTSRDGQEQLLRRLVAEQRRTNRLLETAIYFGGGLVTGILVVQLFIRWHAAW